MNSPERPSEPYQLEERYRSLGRDWRGRPPLEHGGGPTDPPGMEARVAVLEQIAKSTESVLKEIKDDLRSMRDKQDKDVRGLIERQERDFRITFGALITTALGLAFMMAKGFKWL